jgi:hypothetical protein
MSMRNKFCIAVCFNCYIVNENNWEAYVDCGRTGILFNTVQPQVYVITKWIIRYFLKTDLGTSLCSKSKILSKCMKILEVLYIISKQFLE